jgi:hypothetical protein
VHSLADVIAISASHPDKAKYGEDRLIESEAAPFYTPIGEAQSQLAIDRAHAEIDQTLDGANAIAFVAPDGSHIGVGAAAGHPQVVVPIGYPGGARMGAAFLGRRYSEPEILDAASALEATTHARVPPTQVGGGATPSTCAAASQPPFAPVASGTTRARPVSAMQPAARARRRVTTGRSHRRHHHAHARRRRSTHRKT